MSSQQILKIDKSALLEKFTKQVVHSADQEYFQRYFKIGESFDLKKALFFNNLERIICSGNCELESIIYKKINCKNGGM